MMAFTPIKLPTGLIPEVVFEEDRQYERLIQITDAIKRYAEAGKPIPTSWANELSRRIDVYRGMCLKRMRIPAEIQAK